MGHLERMNAASTSADLQRAEARANAAEAMVRELEEREAIWREYELFLSSGVAEPVAIAYVHGWRCSPEFFARGEEYRRRLGIVRPGEIAKAATSEGAE